MHEVVTLGMVLWAVVAIVGGFFALGALILVLSIFADAWKH